MNSNELSYDVAIIGAGASGLMASVGLRSAESDLKIAIIDKNDKIGKKMYITGKGRCNVCNKCNTQDIVENTVHNGKFLYKSLQNFGAENVIDFIEHNGCKLKVERGNRVFPVSDKSSDVIKVFSKFIERNNIDLFLNYCVDFIKFDLQTEKFFIYQNVKSEKQSNCICANKLIVATGGVSYPATGSCGDGYKFATFFGHSIIEPKPALCGFKVKGIDELAGLTLKNAGVVFKISGKQKLSEFGDITFYKDLIAGPVCLTASSLLNDYNKNNSEIFEIEIDLKFNVEEKEFKERFYGEVSKCGNEKIIDFLNKFMPNKMAHYFIRILNLAPKDKVCELKKDILNQIFLKIRKLSFKSIGLDDIKNGIITSGGVNVKEIDPSNMQSKIVKNLYFVGEVMDLDAFTGGFNMQIAFSTGYTCGEKILQEYVQAKTSKISCEGE